MFGDWRAISNRDRFNLLVFASFALVLIFFGGASRADAIGQGIVRLAGLAVIALCAVQLKLADLKRLRAAVLLLVSLAVLIGVQLIPLPPGLWESLPGHAPFAQVAYAGGIEPTWRPISMTPDRTLNALLALLPAVAALALMLVIPPNHYPLVLTGLLLVIAVSVAFGVMQVGTGSPYFYQVTNRGSAVGIFANRNHSALFVALSLPLLAGWFVLSRLTERDANNVRAGIAMGVAVLVFPILLVTGSRGGLVLGVIGLFAGLLIALTGARGAQRRAILAIAGGAAGMLVLMTGVFAFFSRDEALTRLLASDRDDLRGDIWPTVVRMVGDFFPVGSGFGSFDPLYRFYEVHKNLGPYYINQAHNDWLQIALEGGLVALLIVLAMAVWYILRTARVWRSRASPVGVLARTGSVALAMIVVGSLFDYPLRTPSMAVVFIVAVAWLCGDNSKGKFPLDEARR